LGLIVLFILRERIELKTTVLLIGIFLFADTGYSILSYGIEARSFLGIGYLCIFTGFVFGMRWGIASLVFASSLMLLKGILLKLGYLDLEDHLLMRLKTLEYWSVLAFSFLFYPLPLIFLLVHTKQRLKVRIEELSRITEALESESYERKVVSKRLEDIIRTPVAGFFILEQGSITDMNDKAREILGVGGSTEGLNLMELVHPSDRDVLRELFSAQDGPKERIIRILRNDGVRYVALSLAPLAMKSLSSGIMIDVTREKMLEAELMYTKRSYEVAGVVRGIAHDFNNILTTIEGHAFMLAQSLREGPSIRYAEKISSSCERARKLIGDLMLFGKKEPLNLVPTDVNRLLFRAESVIREMVTEDTEVEVHPLETGLTVMCDTAKMERVFLNLASNARDAMEGEVLKRIVIKAEPFTMGIDFISKHGFGKPGFYVAISVSDTGCGMSEDTRRRIFEPFFSTKGPGKGSGLGLSIIYSIVKDHGGYITVESKEREGSTFSIYLPAEKSEGKEKL
ncbi:MAG: ATP-binding protein, partial [Nitrososphaerales archaeon]